MTDSVQVSPSSETDGALAPRGHWKVAVVLLVLAVAAVIRIIDFPQRYEFRDEDETGYLSGSLALAEGLTPGFKAAPAGPLFWSGWAYTNAQAAKYFIYPTPRERNLAIQVRPFAAIDRALFNDYRDLSSLHRFCVVLTVALAVVAAAAAAGLGFELSGLIGGIMLGGLFAVMPLCVALSEMSRPYSQAWSFGVISLYFAARKKDDR